MDTREYKEIKSDLKKIVMFLEDTRIYYHGDKLIVPRDNYYDECDATESDIY